MDKRLKLIEELNRLGLFFTEASNGQITVDRVSIWLKKEKWYDPIEKVKGLGINSYLNYITKKI